MFQNFSLQSKVFCIRHPSSRIRLPENFSVTWSYTASHATLSLTFPAVYFHAQYNPVFVAGCMCFVRKLPLMCPLYKHSAVPGRFLDTVFSTVPTSGTSLIFVIIVIVDFLTQFFSFLGYLFAKLFLVHLTRLSATCSFWNFFYSRMLLIWVPSIKISAWVYHPVVQCFVQNMCKNFFTQLPGESVCKRHNLAAQSEESLPASYIRETNGMLRLLVYPGTSDVKTRSRTNAELEPS